MANKKELFSLFEQLFTLKTLTQTYQQIAANQVRKTRASVVDSRDFISELLGLFQEVKSIYRQELVLLMKQKKINDPKKFSFIKRNGKTTAVFISANTGLYGTIVNKTASMLNEYLKRHEADVTIIGKLGEQLFKQNNPERPYTFFDLADSKIESEKMKNITKHLLQYENILVFYGQFQSIVSQNPIIASLDSGASIEDQAAFPLVKYLFEPSVEKIIIFFETEIFGLVFEQTIKESQLAKYASRMYALDRAIQNINTDLGKVKKKEHVLHHRTINTKQQNSLSGISLWNV